MKKLVSFLSGIALLCGCSTVPTNPTTQADIDKAAVFLRAAAQGGATVALMPPYGQTNNAKYFALAADGLSLFTSGTNFSPAALQADLRGVNLGGGQYDTYVLLAIGIAVDGYQLYLSQYTAGTNNANAIELVNAVRDGFNLAINRISPVSPAVLLDTANAVSVPRPVPAK